MTELNRVNVKIYGQEFTISGDQPRDHIIKVADHVDRRMHELATILPPCPVSSLAVLTAVNSADEYYTAKTKFDEVSLKYQQMDKDVQHYQQLWEEAKRNFLQYKENAQSASEQKEELLKKYHESEEQNASLLRKNENLMHRMEAQEDEKESSSSVVKELELKCKDMESIYFDLQMENIQLKAELDRYKKIVE